jgi:glycosyltransferase involved in cell wall biosynthesis
MLDELAIVIPAKNEEDMIGNLLSSLCIQNYSRMRETPIFIADADSTDATIQVANSYAGRLDIRIVKGGTPSEGRNAGANAADSRYILFLDADIELTSKNLITRAVNMMKRQERHCITTCILSKEKSLIENLMYCANLAIQVGSKFSRPFCPGAFMLFDRERFMQLGGFNEKVLYAEDYFLTRNVESKRFGILPGFVRTSNRRFQKMGRINFLLLFLRTVVNSGDDNYFYQNHGYWK